MATKDEPTPEVSSSTHALTKLNVKIVDNDKNTKFHYLAACGEKDKISKDLIERQKIDIENYLGWTPLMMACKNGHIEMVKLLLDFGADPSRKNRFGMSVFLISIASGNLEIVKLVLQHLLCGGISKRSLQTIFSPLSVAVLFHNHDILQFLIGQQFDVNGSTPCTGITPLMLATAMEDDPSFAMLMTNKADPAIKNYIGLTASDIKKSREIKEEKPTPAPLPPPPVRQPLQQPPLTPAELISNSPHMSAFTNPVRYISPHPTFYVMTPEPGAMHSVRKSSNALTPSPSCFIATPHLTPIGTMALVPQIFFPPNFSSTFSLSPGIIPNAYGTSNDLLNAHINPNINQSALFLSPSISPNNGYISPCV